MEYVGNNSELIWIALVLTISRFSPYGGLPSSGMLGSHTGSEIHVGSVDLRLDRPGCRPHGDADLDGRIFSIRHRLPYQHRWCPAGLLDSHHLVRGCRTDPPTGDNGVLHPRLRQVFVRHRFDDKQLGIAVLLCQRPHRVRSSSIPSHPQSPPITVARRNSGLDHHRECDFLLRDLHRARQLPQTDRGEYGKGASMGCMSGSHQW